MKCSRCNGTGEVKEGAKFTGSTTQCKGCGFQAIGKLIVDKLQKNGGYCSDCRKE